MVPEVKIKACKRVKWHKPAIRAIYDWNYKEKMFLTGRTMGGPLSVTFSDIYMVKMENDVVIPSKSFIADL